MRLSHLALYCFFALTSCASPRHQEIHGVREGMDKDDVLEQAGDPRRTFRAEGKDHWIYVFQKDNKLMLQQIDFEQGKVVRVGQPKANSDTSDDDLESADTLEEFERRAKARQRKN